MGEWLESASFFIALVVVPLVCFWAGSERKSWYLIPLIAIGLGAAARPVAELVKHYEWRRANRGMFEQAQPVYENGKEIGRLEGGAASMPHTSANINFRQHGVQAIVCAGLGSGAFLLGAGLRRYRARHHAAGGLTNLKSMRPIGTGGNRGRRLSVHASA